MKINKQLISEILNNINDLSILNLYEKDKIYYLRFLHDVGIIRYNKLTSENYYYWWYEVDAAKEKPDKRRFTASLTDFILTLKGDIYLRLSRNSNFEDQRFSDIFLIAEKFYDEKFYDDPGFAIENFHLLIATKKSELGQMKFNF